MEPSRPGNPVRRSTLPISPPPLNWMSLPFISKTPIPPPSSSLLLAITTLLLGLAGSTQIAASSETSPEPEKPTFSSRGRTPTTRDGTGVAVNLAGGGVVAGPADGAPEAGAVAGTDVVGAVDGAPEAGAVAGAGVVGPVGSAPDPGSSVRLENMTSPRVVKSAKPTRATMDVLNFTWTSPAVCDVNLAQHPSSIPCVGPLLGDGSEHEQLHDHPGDRGGELAEVDLGLLPAGWVCGTITWHRSAPISSRTCYGLRRKPTGPHAGKLAQSYLPISC